MRVAVTGGAGFLGSHVADGFAARGHDVHVIDLHPANFHPTSLVDMTETDAVETVLRGTDVVCHLGGIGDVYLATRDPRLAAHANVTGTAAICEAARRAGVGCIVYASTWEVYGRPRYTPMDEQHPCNPEHPYNITKLAGERMALAASRSDSALRTIALRLGTAYGERMRPNSVFALFATRAIRGEPLVIHGTGQQARQFTHASDIALAFVLAATSNLGGAVFNVVSDEQITIRMLAEMVAAELPTSIRFAEAREGDVPTAAVSNNAIKSELGWQPRVTFRDGLAALIAWHRKESRV
jgi:UDP-glucose 4-epimerase